MSIRFREKQSLYHSLGQLVRSGITFPAALQSLGATSRGGVRRLLSELNVAIAGGQTIGEAFSAQHPEISDLEAGIVAAVERAGRLDRGLVQLASYFGALDAARTVVIKRLAYPLFLLHFGILALGVPTLMSKGVNAYLLEVGSIFALIYGIGIVCVLGVPMLSDLGAKNPTLDLLLRRLPVVGRIRENFAVARFCATYEMQLGAGVNVMDSLKAAARAGRSGLITAAVKTAVPQVIAGAQVGPLLASSHAFPQETLRGISVGEQTGRLDEELDRLAAEHQAKAVSALDTLAEWGPRLIYIGTCLYVGLRIVAWYAGYLKQATELLG